MTQASASKILVVDDEPNNLRLLSIDLKGQGYEVITANDGVEGWELLAHHKNLVKVILLDRMMPNMDGMEFMAKLKKDSSVSDIPVIMQTAAAEQSQVLEGIKAGVYYYLTKPYNKEIMLSIVAAAIEYYRQYLNLKGELNKFKQELHVIDDCHMSVSKLDEITDLSTFLSNLFPEPQRVVLGISELLINAIEHGNLGITYDEKTDLKMTDTWEQEINRRLALPQFRSRIAKVRFVKDEEKIILVIKDEGKGFNWQSYLELSPERATHYHGRGIAMSNLISFDKMEYNDSGNQVTCTVYLK